MDKLDIVARFELYKHLSGKELLRLCKTSKKFYEICNLKNPYNNNLWVQKIREDFNINLQTENALFYYREYLKFLNDNHLDQKNLENIFMAAVEKRNFEIINVLLKHSELNPTFLNNRALNFAVSRNDIEMVNLLLSDERITSSDLLHIFSRAMQNRYIIAKLLLNNTSLSQNMDVLRFTHTIDQMIEQNKGFGNILLPLDKVGRSLRK